MKQGYNFQKKASGWKMNQNFIIYERITNDIIKNLQQKNVLDDLASFPSLSQLPWDISAILSRSFI